MQKEDTLSKNCKKTFMQDNNLIKLLKKRKSTRGKTKMVSL